MKPNTAKILRKRTTVKVTTALVTGVAFIAASVGLSPLAQAADPLGSVTAFSPEGTSILSGSIVEWQGEMLATRTGAGGFTAFVVASGVAVGSPLAPAGVVKSPVKLGNLLAWIDSTANVVRTANPGGTVTALAGSVVGYDSMIVVGSDLWLSKPGAIDRVTPNLVTGTLGLAATVGSFGVGSVLRMAVGSDGNVWVVEKTATVDTIRRFAPNGTPTGASANFANNAADPSAVVLGADGAAWVLETGVNAVARFDNNLSATELVLPAGSGGTSITASPDGGVWVAEAALNNVSRLSFAGGAITRTAYNAPSSFGLRDLAVGPDGNIWAVGTTQNKVAKFGTAVPVTTTTSPATTTSPVTTTAPPTTLPPTTVPAVTPSSAPPTTAPAAPVTTIKQGVVYRCVKSVKKKVKVGKKFVTKSVCTKFQKV